MAIKPSPDSVPEKLQWQLCLVNLTVMMGKQSKSAPCPTGTLWPPEQPGPDPPAVSGAAFLPQGTETGVFFGKRRPSTGK